MPASAQPAFLIARIDGLRLPDLSADEAAAAVAQLDAQAGPGGMWAPAHVHGEDCDHGNDDSDDGDHPEGLSRQVAGEASMPHPDRTNNDVLELALVVRELCGSVAGFCVARGRPQDADRARALAGLSEAWMPAAPSAAAE
jgi:hypothetical protein